MTGSAADATHASAGAAIVADFPSRLIPAPPGASVTASAVQRHGGTQEISLSATTRAPVAAVLDFYRMTLAQAGFSVTRDSMLPLGATGLAFSRDGGQDLLVVAVVDQGATRSFSIGGTVATGA